MLDRCTGRAREAMDASHRGIRRVGLAQLRCASGSFCTFRKCATDLVPLVCIVATDPYVTLAHFTTLMYTLGAGRSAPRTRKEREAPDSGLRH